MAEQLQSLSDEQLVANLQSRERELVSLRFRHSMNQLENTATLRTVRKDIARIQTEARRREVAGGLSKGALVARHAATTAPAGTTETGAAAPDRGGFLKGIVDKLTGKE